MARTPRCRCGEPARATLAAMTTFDSESQWTSIPQVIETARLRLRPWRLGDVDDVFAYAQDGEWSRFLRILPRPYERSHAEQFVARQLLANRETRPSWAVTLEGSAIGGVNLTIQREHNRAEAGYSIGRKHWNRGFCSEAVRAVIDAAFEACPGLNRICAMADLENGASQRVMEKLGMKKEGVLRQNRVERGESIDEAWWGILRSEWSEAS